MELKENKTVSAKELYKELGIRKDYSTWIRINIQSAGLEQGKDFSPLKGESTGGRPSIDYLLVRDAALTIIVMSGGQKANDVRRKLIELYNQHDTGLAFTAPQIEALIDLSRAMTLISLQKEYEKKHFELYNNRYEWYQYRAGLLGYSTSSLIKAMKEVNKKHKTIRASLMKLDSAELIRTGVIDFMVAMGKSQEYAVNVGNLCKSIAKKAKFTEIIWDDTKENPLGLNDANAKECQNLIQKSIAD